MAGNVTRDALAKIEYGGDLPVLVLADSVAGGTRWRKAAELAGCRVADVVPVDGGLERLQRQVAAAAVLVDVEGEPGVELERLMERLDLAARDNLFGSVVASSQGLIDRLFAATPHRAVVQLCDATLAERVAAVAAACLPAPQRLHDVGKGQGTSQLQRLSEEVGRIAGILARLSDDEAVAEAPAPAEDGQESPITASEVRAIIRARRLRDHYFQAELFADPAWDMLLDLMAARLDRQRVAVSSLCIAAAVPPTTALRWIKTLTEQGLFIRTADPHDGRRVFIELSDKAAAQLAAYLKGVRRLSPLAI